MSFRCGDAAVLGNEGVCGLHGQSAPHILCGGLRVPVPAGERSGGGRAGKREFLVPDDDRAGPVGRAQAGGLSLICICSTMLSTESLLINGLSTAC